MPKPKISPEARQAEIRRKLGNLARTFRIKVATLDPAVRSHHRAAIDGYLVALSAWEAGTANWPDVPEVIITTRYGARRDQGRRLPPGS